MQFQVRPLERRASLGVALQHEYVRVMIFDDDSAAASQKNAHARAWPAQRFGA